MVSALSGVLDEAFRLARVRVGAEIAVTTRIARLCTLLRESTDPAAPLGEVIAAAAAATGMDGGIVHLSEAGGIRVVASRNVPTSITDAFVSFGLAGSPLLAVRGQVVVEHADSPSVSDPDFLLMALQRGGVHSYVSTPLLSSSGRAFGALSLVRTRPGAIGDRERLLLARVAQQLAESLDRRKDDATRARNEASLRAILDSVSEAIVTIDQTGTVLSANPAVERILGYLPDELVGRNIVEITADRERENHACGLRRYVAGGEAKVLGRTLEVMARRKDGSDVAVELVVTEIEPRRLFTGVMRDITERRATEARLRQSDRLTSLGTLAAGLGHDMNNVLFPVRAHLNALLADAARSGAADRQEHVMQIGRGVEYLQKLADGLHYLVHDPGHADGGLDGARLAEWWRGTGPLLSRGLPPLARVDVDIAEGLPRVRASEHALTQAVLNLFVNAGEAIASVHGGPAAHVRIAAHAAPDGRAVLLSVTDNGPGMPESVRKRAFDMFFTTKTRGLGTGLGLALVNRVAREAGGSASIESRPGQGTVVTLRLPVADTEPLFAGVGVAVTAADGRAGSFIESALAGRGFAVLPAERLPEARAWFVDPRLVTPADAMAWKRGRTDAAVILVGNPHRLQRKEWAGIADGTIDSIKNFDSLLVGVDRACSSIQRRWADERDDHACGTEAVAGARDGAQEGDQPDHGPRAAGGSCPFRR
jgi:PAS domain S-box-containing protein